MRGQLRFGVHRRRRGVHLRRKVVFGQERYTGILWQRAFRVDFEVPRGPLWSMPPSSRCRSGFIASWFSLRLGHLPDGWSPETPPNMRLFKHLHVNSFSTCCSAACRLAFLSAQNVPQANLAWQMVVCMRTLGVHPSMPCASDCLSGVIEAYMLYRLCRWRSGNLPDSELHGVKHKLRHP
ncbi:hypothetical protein PsYK624_081090 [Phanerochaete sordida]|uniref:Uncharacterized protein n=1 Tax=Phanerochaete sordida TaxID=48140 RepID=A0A9P3G9Z5_9APHY|nr:hypothetical protein PsYK624_081090 [Phanerochaete sordida]